ncbi:hypothetical protein HPB48_026591 [Haemaphysalis longicornis]|uniref:Uncharacterized protein n=1 Tax=Haemaphysalis longicornis TaxID=44386 RepID=A0A9J6H9W4_HAELO|nr:hypothetical protein HPB48_026591 [Haemaphysalis longicornis]
MDSTSNYTACHCVVKAPHKAYQRYLSSRPANHGFHPHILLEMALCSVTISCAQHGTAAVKRHASQKKHLEAAAKLRDPNGVLLAPKTVQATIDFSRGAPRATLQDQVCEAEAIFAMSVVSKSIPYAWGSTATDIYKMFPDSDVAKNFNCGRAKLSYVISDGLGPFFKSKLVA